MTTRELVKVLAGVCDEVYNWGDGVVDLVQFADEVDAVDAVLTELGGMPADDLGALEVWWFDEPDVEVRVETLEG